MIRALLEKNEHEAIRETEILSLRSSSWVLENGARLVGKEQASEGEESFGVEGKWPAEFSHVQFR